MKLTIFILLVNDKIASVSLWKPSSEYSSGIWKEVEVTIPKEIIK